MLGQGTGRVLSAHPTEFVKSPSSDVQSCRRRRGALDPLLHPEDREHSDHRLVCCSDALEHIFGVQTINQDQPCEELYSRNAASLPDPSEDRMRFSITEG